MVREENLGVLRMIPYYLRCIGTYIDISPSEYLLMRSYKVLRVNAAPLRVHMNGYVAYQYTNNPSNWNLQADLSNNRVRSLCKKTRWEF